MSEYRGRVFDPLPCRARGDGLGEGANGVKVAPRRRVLHSLRSSSYCVASFSRAAESPEKQVGDARGERRALSVGVRYFFGELPRFHRLFESALSDERLAEQVAGPEVGTGAQRETRHPLSEVDLADRPPAPGAT